MTETSDRLRASGSGLARALADVFGYWPAWPWSACAVIVGCGLIGMATAPLFTPVDGTPHPAVRWAAVTGYGLAVGGLLTLVPRMLKLQQCSRDLKQRPANGADWWPYRLLATALVDVPALRATPEDFKAAVDRTRVRVRGLLATRFWPATAVAFVVPVFGLISAWESGSMVRVTQADRAAIYAVFLPQVAPPMVATISIALVLLLVIVGIDQWTKSLLAGWANQVRFADIELPAVQNRIEPTPLRPEGDGDVSGIPGRVKEGLEEKPPPVPPGPEIVGEEIAQEDEKRQGNISVDKFEDLIGRFR